MVRVFVAFFLVSCFLAACQKKITTTPREYAMLSAHVYDDNEVDLPEKFHPFLDFNKKDYSHQFNIDLNKIWKLAEDEDWGSLIPYIGVKAFSRGGYFGRAYSIKNTNQIIIAHRGTDLDIKINELSLDQLSLVFEDGKFWDFLMDMDDDYDIFEGKIPQQQFQAAQFFVGQVKKEFIEKHQTEPEIIHTGHSLGAVLAELCAVKDNSTAITFESPGSKPLASQLSDIEGVNLAKVKIKTYNAEPNQINSLHEHLGDVVWLYDTNQKQSLQSDAAKVLSLKQHPIKELIKKFDETTGEPKDLKSR